VTLAQEIAFELKKMRALLLPGRPVSQKKESVMASRRTILLVTLAVATVVVLALAAQSVQAQRSGRDEAFGRGLQRRGLLGLLEQFLEDQMASGGDPLVIKQQQAALHAMQAWQSGDENERDRLFGKSKTRYRELIEAFDSRKNSETRTKDKDALRYRVLSLRLTLAEMIWQKEAFNSLNFLELTNKQRGNREKVARLMRQATTLFQEINTEAAAWSKEMEQDTDYENRYLTTGLGAKVVNMQDYSNYQIAWTSYYLAYALPSDDKEGQRLLKDAIAKFGIFTKREEDFQAKWESYKGLGMVYREQADFAQAVTNFRLALDENAPEKFRIGVFYELAQTYLWAEKFAEARQTVDEFRNQQFPTLDQTFHGATLLPLLDARITLAEGQADPAKREAGLQMMRQLWQRGGFWNDLVTAEVGRYIAKKKVSELKPFELWTVASQAFNNEKYAEAANYFEQYVKATKATENTHPVAKYNLARCYDKMADGADDAEKEKLLTMAANGFYEIAAKFPRFESRDQAAQAYVQLASKIYQMSPTPENLERYSAALEWIVKKGPQTPETAETQYLHAMVLKRQTKYREAAREFAKVGTDSQRYYEAMYESPNCYGLDLLENKHRVAQKELMRLASEAVIKMENYVNEARKVRNPPDELRKELKDNGAQMLVRAGEILAQREIQQYARGLKLIERYQKEYGDQDQYKGAALKVKIDCYQGLGQTELASKELEVLMATSSGEDVGRILRDLFVDITEEIKLMVSRGRYDRARQRVALADKIGGQFNDFLIKTKATWVGKKDAAKEIEKINQQVETVRFQLAELHMQARDLEGPSGAIQRYQALIGFDPYITEFVTINHYYLAGLARSTQIRGLELLKGKQRKAAYEMLKRSVSYWDLVSEGYAADTDAESKRKTWEADFERCQVRADLHPLEQEFNTEDPIDYYQQVRDFIAIRRASKSKFGEPDIKVKFDRLADKLGMGR